jgi:hypothetical protein
MEGVWTELLKRRRSDYKSSQEFRYPATPQMEWSPTVRALLRRAQMLHRNSASGNEREAKQIEAHAALVRVTDNYTWGTWSWNLPIQELALVAFFDLAFHFACSAARPVPRALAQKRRAHFLNMASRIRADVASLDGGFSQRLIDAAFAYEELADGAAPPPGHPLLVQRKRRSDERQTAFVIELAAAAAAIFGQRLYGTVAVVANVAFECDDWTGARVRKVTQRIRP